MKKFSKTLVLLAAVLLILPTLSFATPTPPAPETIHILNADSSPAIDILVAITADGTDFIVDPADGISKEAQLWYYDYTFTNVGWKIDTTPIGISRATIPFGSYLFGAEIIGGSPGSNIIPSSITATPGDPRPGDLMANIYAQQDFVLTFDFFFASDFTTLDLNESATVRLLTANLWTEGTITLFDTVTRTTMDGDVPLVDEAAFFQVKNGVPEPGTLLLLGSGILGLAALHRRRENNK
jgi:hypothetical protein